MNEDTLLDKFLVLGGTTKQGEPEATGGWGVAKAAIIGACGWWQVHTHNLHVSFDHVATGSPIAHTDTPVDGCKVTLHYRGESSLRQDRSLQISSWAIRRALRLLAFSEAPVTFRVTGPWEQEWGFRLELDPEDLSTEGAWQGKTSWRIYQVDPPEVEQVQWRDDSWQVPTAGQIIWRLNSLAQFAGMPLSGHPHSFIIDVETTARPGESDYPFDPGRENVVQDLRDTIENILQRHRANPITSIGHRERKNKRTRPDTMVYTGRLLGQVGGFQGESPLITRQVAAELCTVQRHSSIFQTVAVSRPGGASPIGIQIMLRGLHNYSGDPLCRRNLRLLKLWAGVVTLVHELGNITEEYGVGLIFDDLSTWDQQLAERYKGPEGIFYLIEPRRLRLTNLEGTLLDMMESAAHEVAHKNYPDHTEAFTAQVATLYRACVYNWRHFQALLKEKAPKTPGQQLALF